jgi:competence transcription factor ComK
MTYKSLITFDGTKVSAYLNTHYNTDYKWNSKKKDMIIFINENNIELPEDLKRVYNQDATEKRILYKKQYAEKNREVLNLKQRERRAPFKKTKST